VKRKPVGAGNRLRDLALAGSTALAAPWRVRRPGHNGRERCAMSRGETLKSCRPVSLAGYQLPAAGPMPVSGLDKPS